MNSLGTGSVRMSTYRTTELNCLRIESTPPGCSRLWSNSHRFRDARFRRNQTIQVAVPVGRFVPRSPAPRGQRQEQAGRSDDAPLLKHIPDRSTVVLLPDKRQTTGHEARQIGRCILWKRPTGRHAAGDAPRLLVPDPGGCSRAMRSLGGPERRTGVTIPTIARRFPKKSCWTLLRTCGEQGACPPCPRRS